MIIRTELIPVILSPKRLTKNTLSVTKTMERAKDRAILSRTLSCLKKKRLQANPGRKKTNTKPSITLMANKCSRNDKTNPKNSLTDDIKSALLNTFYHYPHWEVI